MYHLVTCVDLGEVALHCWTHWTSQVVKALLAEPCLWTSLCTVVATWSCIFDVFVCLIFNDYDGVVHADSLPFALYIICTRLEHASARCMQLCLFHPLLLLSGVAVLGVIVSFFSEKIVVNSYLESPVRQLCACQRNQRSHYHGS